MLFNSFNFLIFFIAIFILHWFFFKTKGLQNNLLLGSSYFFYANWDWRFLSLLIFSTLVCFYIGNKIHETRDNRKTSIVWLSISLLISIGLLIVFKYFNFFIKGLSLGLSFFGFNLNSLHLEILLPVGISFYTFHGMSYVIDIYRKEIEPETNFIDYALFVSFFPLLVAGPIERAKHLLPQ